MVALGANGVNEIFSTIQNSGSTDDDTVYTDAEIGVKDQEATIDYQANNQDKDYGALDDVPEAFFATDDVDKPLKRKGVGNQDAEGDENWE